MSTVQRNITGIRSGALEFFRNPINVVLLFVLPILSIKIMATSWGQIGALNLIDIPGSLETMGQILGAMFATGTVAGLLGLFQIVSASDTDRRLVLCGYPPLDLLFARFVSVLAISVAVASVTLATLFVVLSESIEAPLYAFLALVSLGLTYGLLGMLIGSLVPREFEGSLVLIFISDMDVFLASNLYQLDESIIQLSPMYHPYQILTQAINEGGLATTHVLPIPVFLVIFGLIALVGYIRTTGAISVEGDI